MDHGDLALLFLIVARVHMDDLPMNLALFPVYGSIEVRCVFIGIVNIDGVFLLWILCFFSIKIFLRSLHRATIFEAVEG